MKVIKAILFADVKGYSKLKEHEVFYFVKHVFGQVRHAERGPERYARPLLNVLFHTLCCRGASRLQS